MIDMGIDIHQKRRAKCTLTINKAVFRGND